jgi:peptidyl-prolyl cis-trans isomerase D
MIKVVLILVALSFVAWGGYRIREQRLIRVASVNGDPITIDEYKQSYRNLIDQLQQTFGNSLNDETIKMLKVDRQAIDRLVDQKLLLQEARKLNIQVSEQELSNTIRKMPVFQQAGAFDPRRYRTILGNARLDPETFETLQMDSILVQKLTAFVTGTVKVSEAEAMEWYRWQNASVSLDYLLFDPEKYKDIQVGDADIEKYFSDNKESYRTEPKIKTRYLFFDPQTYLKAIQISNEEIDDYYTSNPQEFKTSKTVEARHVLLKLPPDAAEDVVESTRERALEVSKLAKAGEDFAALAKKYSEGPTKDSGGHLGTFEKNAMVKPFADKAFSMKAGESSDPVRTQFGWHVIKVEKVNEASTLPPEKAKETIREKFAGEKAKQLAYENAESVYDTIYDGDDLKKLAEERKLTLKTTDYFTKQQGPEGVGNRLEFASAAYTLSEMQISEIKDFQNGYYIIQLTDKVPSKIPELKTVEVEVKVDATDKKQNQKAETDATACLDALNAGKSISDESKQYGVKVKTTSFFKRNEPIPDIGYEPEMAAVVFKLSGKKPLPNKAVKGRSGYYVIRLKDRKEPEADAFTKEKKGLTDNLLQTKRQKAFRAWLADVRKNSEVTIEKGLLKEEPQ